ncbi:hypothetical protein GCM10010377_52780 [Streptomyces viridiviolaceus]|uniref:Amino acid permease n=1 Tax=Streptomyces viridiviolaceus TaxID=68282 RepID=A0ABW2E327_9ACTN|nr:amino acid permease [Streptomyces viridiviolaceus]GHB55007.1 hypothetical protein GCM10010377_52780 [Streptomyces viridiviolaceus]
MRAVIFYVGSLTVLLSVLSWTHYTPGASPFVQFFAQVGIPMASGIMNFVVLTAALSSCNSGMFSTGRMLRGLARNGEAPRALGKLSAPTAAARMGDVHPGDGVGVIVNRVSPDNAFELERFLRGHGGDPTATVAAVFRRSSRKTGQRGAPLLEGPKRLGKSSRGEAEKQHCRRVGAQAAGPDGGPLGRNVGHRG